ncbi:MAG: MlaD family protein [Deltaproteobacteria bacterium]|nr:MlaD family protein [Deltaproteobacteria bacterium]
MAASARSIEVKVGVLILVGVALLAGLILVMGGITFQRKFQLFVDFENPGGIQPGAPVKMAGVRVGTIEALEFRASTPDPLTGRRTLVRARIAVEERYHREIHRNSEFYVTTQGVLGEQFLAIDPGTGSDQIAAGSTVVGLGPPRIDLFVARAYTLLDEAVAGVANNRDQIRTIVRDLAGVLHHTNELMARNTTRVDRLLDNTDQLIRDSSGLVNGARARYVDGAEVRRILARTESVLATLDREVPPLSRDARSLMANANRIANGVGDQQIQDVQHSLHDLRSIAARGDAIATDAQRITQHVRQGRGTIGSLMMDEEVYDDLQELVRDLKHNPWKFFWRE